MDLSKTGREEIFWNWFTKNQNKYLFLDEVNFEEREKLMDELLIELHKYNKNLYFEIGGDSKNKKVEFIISAEGNVSYFSDVETLTYKAPEYEKWNIIAFKPPMGKGSKTEYKNRIFDSGKIMFIPLINNKNPKAVGIDVCYDDYDESEKDNLIIGTYLILDCILGEKSSALDIDYLEVIKTPENIIDYEFIFLDEIERFIIEKKQC